MRLEKFLTIINFRDVSTYYLSYYNEYGNPEYIELGDWDLRGAYYCLATLEDCVEDDKSRGYKVITDRDEIDKLLLVWKLTR
jgi:hypothetical protein